MLACLGLAGSLVQMTILFWVGLAVTAWHLAMQVYWLDIDDAAQCLKLFRSNRNTGLIVAATLTWGFSSQSEISGTGIGSQKSLYNGYGNGYSYKSSAKRIAAKELFDLPTLEKLRKRSDFIGFALIVHAWALIFAAMALFHFSPIR